MEHSSLWLFLWDLFHQILFYFGGVVAMLILLFEKKRNKPIQWRWIGAFFLFCLFVSCFQAWIDEHHNSETLIGEKAKLVSDNFALQSKLDNKQLEVDWLRDHRLSGVDPTLAPALIQFAQSTADYTRRQFEKKALTDKQLVDFTTNLVTRIRDLGGKCAAEITKIDMSANAASPSSEWSSMTNEQRGQYFQEQAHDRLQRQEQNEEICNQSYRQQLQGDAVYARDELLTRIGSDGSLPIQVRIGHLAIDGMFAGPDPIDASATYLDALVHQLEQQTSKRR